MLDIKNVGQCRGKRNYYFINASDFGEIRIEIRKENKKKEIMDGSFPV